MSHVRGTYVFVFDWEWNLVGYRLIDLMLCIVNNEVDRVLLDRETSRIVTEMVAGSDKKDFHCTVYVGDPTKVTAEDVRDEYQRNGPDFEKWPHKQIVRNLKPIRLDDIEAALSAETDPPQEPTVDKIMDAFQQMLKRGREP